MILTLRTVSGGLKVAQIYIRSQINIDGFNYKE